MREPVVVGVDGSPAADSAVEWAAEEAARLDRPLHIVHALGRTDSDVPFGADSLEPLSGARILAEAETRASKHRRGLRTTTEAVADTAEYALRTRAAHAFELVVGHRGAGGFAGLLVGSATLKLAGRLPGPVIVVRGDEVAHGEVIVGADLSTGAVPALDYAFEAAAAREARLRIMYAWHLRPGYSVQLGAIAVGEGAERAIAPFRERYPQVEAVVRTLPGGAARRLVELSPQADLLVVGAHGRTGPHLGSVAHATLHHAACPIAIVRER